MNQLSKNNSPANILDAHPHLRQTLELVADKWVVAVLYVLSGGTKRYGELQREIGDISQRMLIRTLRDSWGIGGSPLVSMVSLESGDSMGWW
jgi:DNA-binding HxlR family transcriptional regulator